MMTNSVGISATRMTACAVAPPLRDRSNSSLRLSSSCDRLVHRQPLQRFGGLASGRDAGEAAGVASLQDRVHGGEVVAACAAGERDVEQEACERVAFGGRNASEFLPPDGGPEPPCSDR